MSTKRFPRIRSTIVVIRFLSHLAKSWWEVQKHDDEIEQLATEMNECPDCEGGVPCREHEIAMGELIEGIHGDEQ